MALGFGKLSELLLGLPLGFGQLPVAVREDHLGPEEQLEVVVQVLVLALEILLPGRKPVDTSVVGSGKREKMFDCSLDSVEPGRVAVVGLR